MPTQFTGRLVTIFVVVWVSLSAIFPTVPGSCFWFFNPGTQVSFKPNLKPGIDMVGGTSLLYEIKQPPGWMSNRGHTLAEDVMESLKKRVDPSGVRNLVWRPQGNTRLEIQMPLSGQSAQSSQLKADFLEAQKGLEATNVRVEVVRSAVEDLKGAERDARLAELAMDSEARRTLYGQLARTFDEIEAAKAANDAARQAQAENTYDELKDQIGRSNLLPLTLQEALDAKDAATREKHLAEIREKSKDFPKRLAAIDAFVGKYDVYSKVKGSIDNAGELKRLLKGSGVLEFHILAQPGDGDMTSEKYQELAERLAKDGPQARAGDDTRWYQVDKPEEFKGHNVRVYNDKTYVLAYTVEKKALMHRPGGRAWGLQNASGATQEGSRVVQFQFDPSGAVLFGDLTGSNIGKPLGIVLDDKLISAPNINSKINASGVITGGGLGGFAENEQRYLVATLGAGSLPAQLTEEPISERTVGPQLGADNLKAGLLACSFGLVVVAIFLVSYYYLAGIVAFIAVLINVIVILGVMSMLNATFTLPGVAGIVLAIGAAVDANVLIFERLREEQHRGLSIRMALRNSYDRAWSAILDSNMTTVITSFVLYWLGTEEVKGFGITLLIGLCSSIFTALFVTKTIFGILIEKFGVTDLRSLPLTFPKWDQMLQPKIEWISKVKYFVTFSAIFIAIGCWSFFHYGRKGELLDIEFASGTSVQFDLAEPMHINDVRKLLPDQADLPSPAIVSVGTDSKSYEVVTPLADAVRVKGVVTKALQGKIKAELPSTFNNSDKLGTDVMDASIVAVDRDHVDAIKSAADGFLPGNWQTFRGGAALVLKQINPKLTPQQIRSRIDRARLQVQAGATEQSYRDFAVESPRGASEPTDLAIVFVSDQNFPFDKDAAKWRDEVAVPTWKLITDAITAPPQLQKVSNFDAQVAGESQINAMLALCLSVAVIMAYIWLRFGNFKYGTATVLAMVHDTLLVLAAIGLSHLLVHYIPGIAGALLIEPFRLNITIVAAILTVMSYSMIDTIVVFDRVRENRGKYGSLNRKVVNDSINQTMSRTLLTAGTNIATLFFMYIFGGPGIHGFTFVLLFGIIVGTYSSIAIAAPLLLVGRDPETARAGASGQRGSGAGPSGGGPSGAGPGKKAAIA